MPYYSDTVVSLEEAEALQQSGEFDTTIHKVDAMPPSDDWKPTYWTPMKSTRSLGNDICDFIETVITPPRMFDDSEFSVRAWQRWFLNHAFELNAFGLLAHHIIYLQIPRKNGKSFLASAIMLYFLFKAQGGEQLFAAARNSKQARIVYDEALEQVYGNSVLKKVIRPLKPEMTNRFVRAVFKPLSGDAGSAHGLAPYGTVGDELHTWDSLTGTSTKGKDMYAALTKGSKDRQEWFFLGITTAGSNDAGLSYQLYDYSKKVATGEIEDDTFSCFIWEAEEDDDIYAESTWRKTNPQLVEGLMNLQDFHDDLKTAEATSTADFERYNLNKWIRASEKADFISGFHWRNALKPELGKIPKGARIAVGFDGSVDDDSTGIVGIDIDTGLIEVLHGWEKNPLDENWFVDIEDVEAAMTNVFATYNVVKMYADPSRMGAQVSKWQRTWGRGLVRDIPPTNSRMPSIATDFRTDIFKGELFHVGERRLTKHVRNAIATEKGVPNKDKRNSPRKIDFLAAAILANAARREYIDRNSRKNKGIVTY